MDESQSSIYPHLIPHTILPHTYACQPNKGLKPIPNPLPLYSFEPNSTLDYLGDGHCVDNVHRLTARVLSVPRALAAPTQFSPSSLVAPWLRVWVSNLDPCCSKFQLCSSGPSSSSHPRFRHPYPSVPFPIPLGFIALHILPSLRAARSQHLRLRTRSHHLRLRMRTWTQWQRCVSWTRR